MNQDRYTKIEKSDDYQTFMFVSEGRHGKIIKIVSFSDFLGSGHTFNLALGTVLPDGEMDFETITNNGDRNKILAIVAVIIDIFIAHHPGKSVYITGSDSRRTLLYQRAIAYGHDALIETFYVYGHTDTGPQAYEFEPFSIGKNYAGFLVEKK